MEGTYDVNVQRNNLIISKHNVRVCVLMLEWNTYMPFHGHTFEDAPLPIFLYI